MLDGFWAAALVGCAILWGIAGTPWVVRDVIGARGEAEIRLGPMGKIYLMYLVVVMVAVLMNFERMLRVAPATAQRWLRPLFVAFLMGILSEMLLVSGGLLFSGLGVAWLACWLPARRAAIFLMQPVLDATFVQVKNFPARQGFKFPSKQPPLHLISFPVFYEFFLA